MSDLVGTQIVGFLPHMLSMIFNGFPKSFRIPEKTRKSESSTGGRSTRDDNSADSSPHRSVSAAEDTDSEDEDSGIKPRGMSLAA